MSTSKGVELLFSVFQSEKERPCSFIGELRAFPEPQNFSSQFFITTTIGVVMKPLSIFIILCTIATVSFAQPATNSKHILYKFDDDIIFKTLDSGITWQQLPEVSETITFLAWNKQKPEQVFAVTANNILHRLSEKEKQWTTAFIPEQDNVIQEIGFTRNLNIAWLSVAREEGVQKQFWLSMDGGMTWTMGNGNKSKLFNEDENTVVVFSETNKSRKGAQGQ